MSVRRPKTLEKMMIEMALETATLPASMVLRQKYGGEGVVRSLFRGRFNVVFQLMLTTSLEVMNTKIGNVDFVRRDDEKRRLSAFNFGRANISSSSRREEEEEEENPAIADKNGTMVAKFLKTASVSRSSTDEGVLEVSNDVVISKKDGYTSSGMGRHHLFVPTPTPGGGSTKCTVTLLEKGDENTIMTEDNADGSPSSMYVEEDTRLVVTEHNTTVDITVFGLPLKEYSEFDKAFKAVTLRLASVSGVLENLRAFARRNGNGGNDDNDDVFDDNATERMLSELLNCRGTLGVELTRRLDDVLRTFDAAYVKGLTVGAYEDDGYLEHMLERGVLSQETFDRLCNLVVSSTDDDDESVSLTLAHPYEECLLSLCNCMIRLRYIVTHLKGVGILPDSTTTFDKDTDDGDEEGHPFTGAMVELERLMSATKNTRNATQWDRLMCVLERASEIVVKRYPTIWKYAAKELVSNASRMGYDATARFESVEKTARNEPTINAAKLVYQTIRGNAEVAYNQMASIIGVETKSKTPSNPTFSVTY